MTRTLPRLVHQDNHLPSGLPLWYVMTDIDRLPDPAAFIPDLPDQSAVIVRDTDSERQFETLRRLLPGCRAHGVTLIGSLNRPPRTFFGDGIHIPERSLRYWKQTDITRLQPHILTTSAHSSWSLRKAAWFGVDACLVSPVFATKSHPGSASLGLSRFATICRNTSLPVVGLGGMSMQQSRRILMAGAIGIAGISLFEKLNPED